MPDYSHLDTPALLIDKTLAEKNHRDMVAKARRWNVKLRPHTKTHRTPALARLQVAQGASGITVAKIGEAEVMAAEGLNDIFIANEVYGDRKLARLLSLHRRIRIALGVDNREQVDALSLAFKDEPVPLDVMIEVETGEERTGVLSPQAALDLARAVAAAPGLRLRGVFTHEGHTYGAPSREDCAALFLTSQREVLAVADHLRRNGQPVEEISTGATPSLMLGEVLPGITEIRPGTYLLMDAAQANAIGDYSRCAASVLATVVSKPTAERVVIDAGVKALTSFTRPRGICETQGYGLVKSLPAVRLKKVYDEHGVIVDSAAREALAIGQKIEIIPNHICPTCNLYDKIYIVENGRVTDEWPILCRGKSQ